MLYIYQTVTVILIDPSVSDPQSSKEFLYKLIDVLQAEKGSSFYDKCLVMVSGVEQAKFEAFRAEFYSNFKLFLPIIFVKTEIQAIQKMKRHKDLSFVNVMADTEHKSTTRRFRELMNKI